MGTLGTTTRSVAFLRGINVGGHNVKMGRLRELFGSLGLQNVETFIASGNVIFDPPDEEARGLEKRIEARLQQALGYEVATFIRSGSELMEISRHQPFAASELDGGHPLHVAFLHAPPDREASERLVALRTADDDLHVHGREVYWLCRKERVSDSSFSGALLEKAVKMPATLRNISTVRRLVGKYLTPR